jgi:hypothetical protein
MIRGERLLTALNFLEYLTTFAVNDDAENVVRQSFRIPSEDNPWGFTADLRRLNRVLHLGFGRGTSEDFPLDENGIIGEWDLPTYYSGSCWPAFHQHLKDNIERLGPVELDVASLLHASTDVTDEIGRPQDGVEDARAFGRFLKMMASGELTERDLAALDTDDPID